MSYVDAMLVKEWADWFIWEKRLGFVEWLGDVRNWKKWMVYVHSSATIIVSGLELVAMEMIRNEYWDITIFIIFTPTTIQNLHGAENKWIFKDWGGTKENMKVVQIQGEGEWNVCHKHSERSSQLYNQPCCNKCSPCCLLPNSTVPVTFAEFKQILTI